MAVKITGREYKNRYRPEVVDWLLGNVGDWQTLTLTCEFSIEKRATQTKPIMIENSGTDLVLGDGTEWSDYGFDTGDTIELTARTTEFDGNGNPQSGYPLTTTDTRIISLIQGDRLILNASWIGEDIMLPYNNGVKRIDQVEIYADKKPQAVGVTYGHLKNSEADNANLASFIDGTHTRLLAENTDTLTGWQSMLLTGLQSGMSIESARWIYDSKEGTHTYKYRFEIEFMISSFFEDLSNFETMTAPSQVLGIESLTDNFDVIGYPEYNNPNTRIKNNKSETKRLGNTGWFNENYNGLQNDFTIISLEYTDILTGLQTQRLSYGGETKVKAIISGIPNLANGLTKIGLGFIFLPEKEELYKNLDTPFHKNLFVNTAGGIQTGIFTPSATMYSAIYQSFTKGNNERVDIRDVKFYIQGSNLVYEAIISPTQEISNFIDNLDEADRNYALWLSISDRTEQTNFSDRVSLLLDYNNMELLVPPIGEWDNMIIGFLDHAQDENGILKNSDCGNFKIEDDLLSKTQFKVDISKDIPRKIEFVIETEKTSSGEKYELQRYAVDLTGYPNDINGIPQWDYDQIRGFKLEQGNNKNWVKIKRDPANDDGNNKAYIAYYGFKIRWEDWILRTGVPNDFFNNLAENNGFNNDWYQYLGVGDWDFQFTVYTYSKLNGKDVKYENKKKLTFKDYDQNENIETEWKIIRESDGTNLPITTDQATGKPIGVLLADEQVRLQCIYTKLQGNFMPILNYYGTLCIEVDKGAGQFELRQLSSIWGRENDNPLIPIPGETNTKISLINPTKIMLECLVEPSLLKDALRYKLSSRLGCNFDCKSDIIDKDTKIFIYFDTSGSMNETLEPLTIMRDTLLKDRLLSFYNGDSALYDDNVLIINTGGERTLDMLNMLGESPAQNGKVIVMVFQDESLPIYHTSNSITPRTQQYDIDLSVFLNRLNSFQNGYYNGAVFVVNSGNSENVKFKELIQAIENGTAPYDGTHGLSGINYIKYYYDIEKSNTPQYYLDLLLQAMNDLGFNI